MVIEKIIRVWKDPVFRLSLSEEELAELPENPAGSIELTDSELDLVSGGRRSSGQVQLYSGGSAKPSSSRPSGSNNYLRIRRSLIASRV